MTEAQRELLDWLNTSLEVSVANMAVGYEARQRMTDREYRDILYGETSHRVATNDDTFLQEDEGGGP
jgi:hypothetical protein